MQSLVKLNILVRLRWYGKLLCTMILEARKPNLLICPRMSPLTPCPCDPHPVIYEQITDPLVQSVALKTEEAAGPSGINAEEW